MSLNPGFYNDLSLADYHADPAVSRSDLLLLKNNPLKFKVAKQLLKKQTDVFNIGTAGHAALLQPKDYWNQVSVVPNSVLGKNGSRNTKKYRAWAADPARANKAIITQEQSAVVKGILESVFENPAHSTARGILLNDEKVVEQSIFFKDSSHGFLCKIRPDLRFPFARTLVDIKTSRNASKEAFARDCANLGHDVQAAWYLTGASRATGDNYEEFVFIVIEKEPPYCVAIYRADYEMLDTGRKKIRPLIKLYNDCITKNNWPGYYDGISDLSLPRWAT